MFVLPREGQKAMEDKPKKLPCRLGISFLKYYILIELSYIKAILHEIK